jgi:hypothetical protein
LDKELDLKQKELELERFRREKKMATIQAIISGIVSAVKSFENGGGFPYGLITMALSISGEKNYPSATTITNTPRRFAWMLMETRNRV